MLELLNEKAKEIETICGCSCCDDGDGCCQGGFDPGNPLPFCISK